MLERYQNEIQQLGIVSKKPLGLDIYKEVTDANIKCDRIDIKSFVKSG